MSGCRGDLLSAPIPPPWPCAGLCCRDSLSEKNNFSHAGYKAGGVEVFSQQAACACSLCKKFISALRPESDKEEQSEELETNCEQMSGRIIRNVWKAHQDRLMRQKSTGLAQATAAILEGEAQGEGTSPHGIGAVNKLLLCKLSSRGDACLQAHLLLCCGCAATSH